MEFREIDPASKPSFGELRKFKVEEEISLSKAVRADIVRDYLKLIEQADLGFLRNAANAGLTNDERDELFAETWSAMKAVVNYMTDLSPERIKQIATPGRVQRKYGTMGDEIRMLLKKGSKEEA
jgi:hypothetical protein